MFIKFQPFTMYKCTCMYLNLAINEAAEYSGAQKEKKKDKATQSNKNTTQDLRKLEKAALRWDSNPRPTHVKVYVSSHSV